MLHSGGHLGLSPAHSIYSSLLYPFLSSAFIRTCVKTRVRLTGGKVGEGGDTSSVPKSGTSLHIWELEVDNYCIYTVSRWHGYFPESVWADDMGLEYGWWESSKTNDIGWRHGYHLIHIHFVIGPVQARNASMVDALILPTFPLASSGLHGHELMRRHTTKQMT